MTQQQHYNEWYKSQWQTKARHVTHLLSRMTKFLQPGEKKNITGETIDAVAPNMVALREALEEVQQELIKLEQKRVL